MTIQDTIARLRRELETALRSAGDPDTGQQGAQ